MDQYLHQAKSFADSLVAINEHVSNKDLITGILHGLVPNYKMLVTALLNFPPLPDFADLRARLLSYEAQTHYTDPVHTSHSTVLMATQYQPFFSQRGGFSNRGIGCGRSGSRGYCGRRGRGWNSQQY